MVLKRVYDRVVIQKRTHASCYLAFLCVRMKAGKKLPVRRTVQWYAVTVYRSLFMAKWTPRRAGSYNDRHIYCENSNGFRCSSLESCDDVGWLMKKKIRLACRRLVEKNARRVWKRILFWIPCARSPHLSLWEISWTRSERSDTF